MERLYTEGMRLVCIIEGTEERLVHHSIHSSEQQNPLKLVYKAKQFIKGC